LIALILHRCLCRLDLVFLPTWLLSRTLCLIYSMFNCLIDLIWNGLSYKYASLSTLGVICLVCTTRSIIQRFVAAVLDVVAESATLSRNTLRSKVAQQKSRVSSA